MFYSKFIVTTNKREIEVAASNRFRAHDIATAKLQDGERIDHIARKHPTPK